MQDLHSTYTTQGTLLGPQSRFADTPLGIRALRPQTRDCRPTGSILHSLSLLLLLLSSSWEQEVLPGIRVISRFLNTVLRGTILNTTYDTHKKLPGIYLAIFTNNIWFYLLWSPVVASFEGTGRPALHTRTGEPLYPTPNKGS